MNELKNQLYYGDNLQILREYITSSSVDLIYLDPPFNSNRNYNVLFKNENGTESEAQITAFEDTWHWDHTAESTYRKLITDTPEQVSRMIGALREFIGANQMMAYLVMMTIRLIELHRVLKDTGSLYLHCDPTASHYLKIVLDVVFGGQNFRNEIVWHYRRWTGKAKLFQKLHDIIFFYTKTKNYTFNILYTDYTKGSIERKMQGILHRFKDGEVYLVSNSDTDEKGVRENDVWQIPFIPPSAKERLGYPTQKPLALLERIIRVSSNKSDIILDPFCGCGTAIHAAEKLKRKWIGIDITHLSTSLLKYRLKDAFDLIEGENYEVIGEPQELSAAYQLAQDDRYQFQWWALSLIQAKPIGGQSGSKKGKKGADKGIDGVITFIDEHSKAKRVLIQVKSGKVGVKDIRDLVGTVEREKAAIGVFITFENPTKDMKKEVVSAGYYHSPGWNKDYPRIQILTIEQLLKDKEVQMPPVKATFRKAKKELKREEKQNKLF